MKLHPAQKNGQNFFTAYGEGYADVGGLRYTTNLVVLPERLIPDWTLRRFESLTATDFEVLATLDAEIILLGTGQRLRFPRPEVMQAFVRAQKGLDVMDSHAACRTYNVLVSENRRVAAALLLL